MSCWRCHDHAVIGGDHMSGPDAKWCDCPAAYERMSSEPDYVDRVNQARRKLARFAVKPKTAEEEYRGEF